MDKLEAVERLAKLRDAGVLTELEYAEQKSLVMNSNAIAPLSAPPEYSLNSLRRTHIDDHRYDNLANTAAPQIHIHNVNSQHNPAPTPVYYPVQKSVFLAYVVWFFLGGLGGHRFYLRKSGSAVLLLMLSIVGWSTIALGFGFILVGFAGLWLFIDLFLIPGMADRCNRPVAYI